MESSARAQRRLAIALLVIIAFLVLQILSFGYGRDQGIYALVARTVLEGGMPYRDVFDFKPPGIYLVYALARVLFGNALWGIRALETASLLFTIWCLTRLARRWFENQLIGLLAGAMAALVHAQLDFWHSGQPETFGAMLTVAALVVAAHDKARPSHYLAAGILFGLAGLLKPPLAGGGAVLAFWAAWRQLRAEGGWSALRRVWVKALGPIGWVLLGGIAPFGLCLAWFGAKGALGALHQTFFVFTPHYTALAWADRTLLGMLYSAFCEWLFNFCSLLSIGLLIGLASWRKCYLRPGVGLMASIIAMQLLGIALQGKFFPYHFAACWPLTAMLAALGWWEAWRWALGRGRKTMVSLAVFMALVTSLRTATKDVHESWWRRTARRVRVYLTGAQDQQALDGLASVADVSAKGNREVAAELRRRVPVGGVIYIWGFEPVIYDMADRRIASKYIYNVPQRVAWAAKEARAQLMADLRRTPPDAVVVAYHDVFPMVTGNGIGSEDVLAKDFPELRELLARDFGKLKHIDDFDIYLRR